MIHNILKDKPTKLFVIFSAFFVANALIAECIGGKIFSLEKVFGLQPANLTLFGEKGLSFNPLEALALALKDARVLIVPTWRRMRRIIRSGTVF